MREGLGERKGRKGSRKEGEEPVIPIKIVPAPLPDPTIPMPGERMDMTQRNPRINPTHEQLCVCVLCRHFIRTKLSKKCSAASLK